MRKPINARSAFAGDAPYQRRGRAALPLLVRQAKAEQSITYAELAEELRMPNPRNLNFVLGSVATALAELSDVWQDGIPLLTVVVVNGTTGLPGDGIAEFTNDPDRYLGYSIDQKRKEFRGLMGEIAGYERWDEVLEYFELEPPPPLAETGTPVRGGVAEGRLHLELKRYVSSHPEVVSLPRSAAPGIMEALLPSGDELDVLFEVGQRLVGVEVKAADAPNPEIVRGMYQCEKYKALLEARQKVGQTGIDCTVWLVLGGPLPKELIPLRNTLGTRIVENVAAQPDEGIANS